MNPLKGLEIMVDKRSCSSGDLERLFEAARFNYAHVRVMKSLLGSYQGGDHNQKLRQIDRLSNWSGVVEWTEVDSRDHAHIGDDVLLIGMGFMSYGYDKERGLTVFSHKTVEEGLAWLSAK